MKYWFNKQTKKLDCCEPDEMPKCDPNEDAEQCLDDETASDIDEYEMIEENEIDIEERPISTDSTAKQTTKAQDAVAKQSNKRQSLKCLIIVSFAILLPAVFLGYIANNINNLQRLEPIKYNNVIGDANSYKWFYEESFFKNETQEIFKKILLDNEEVLSTIIDDRNVESAGEAVDIGHVDCRHPYMTLNLNRTKCHFSNRLGNINMNKVRFCFFFIHKRLIYFFLKMLEYTL